MRAKILMREPEETHSKKDAEVRRRAASKTDAQERKRPEAERESAADAEAEMQRVVEEVAVFTKTEFAVNLDDLSASEKE